MIFKILILSLYQELPFVFLFANIQSGKVDIDWHQYASLSDIGNTRAQTTRNFQCLIFRINKCKSDFWMQACNLANIFQDFFKSKVLFKGDCRNKLLDLYTLFFHNIYDENISCIWRIVFGCNKCKAEKNSFPFKLRA